MNKSHRLENAKKNAKRVLAPNPDILTKEDFLNEEKSPQKGRDVFSDLVYVDHIKKVLFELESVVGAAKADGKDPADILADRYVGLMIGKISEYSNVNNAMISI